MKRLDAWVVAVATAALGTACGSSDESSPAVTVTAGQGAGGTATGSGQGGTGGPGAGGGSGGSGAQGGSGGSSACGNGIAALYPGDVGIEGDSAVVVADDFEGYATADDLYQRWDAVYQMDQIHFATDPANVFSGSQALEFTVPQQEAELSNSIDKVLSPEHDVLFLRYYAKFQPPYDVVGSSHNGSSISAHYFVNGQATPGVPADGSNKFLAALENWRGEAATPSPGNLNIYIYHPLQRDIWGDHFFPTGVVLPNTSLPFDFGPDFVSRPDVVPNLDQWYCYEYMVRANTPGQTDGRITAWLDGVLVADFTNLRLRDIETLKIDRLGVNFHIKSNPGAEQKRWFDNVVAATSYIGPVCTP